LKFDGEKSWKSSKNDTKYLPTHSLTRKKGKKHTKKKFSLNSFNVTQQRGNFFDIFSTFPKHQLTMKLMGGFPLLEEKKKLFRVSFPFFFCIYSVNFWIQVDDLFLLFYCDEISWKWWKFPNAKFNKFWIFIHIRFAH
jgi:hypothetical protein